MGIRGLNSMIKKLSPESITTNNISKYKGSKVAIDCSILLYKFKYASKAENSHLVGIANRVKFYLMNEILPVFIFDGVPPESKKITLEKRKAAKHKLYVRLDTLREQIPETPEEKKKIDDEINKILSQLIIVKKQDIDECKEFLEKSGLPYFTAPEDAEKYCAFLQKEKIVDYTITDDTDAMTFGCEKILRTGITREITEIDFSKILQDFGMNYETFVQYCVLSGCDYCETIPQIGPVTAFNVIKKHLTIQKYLETLDKKFDNFAYETAVDIFSKCDYPLPCESRNEVKIKKIDKKILLDFLNRYNFKENVIVKYLKILI